jgi:hypothetical protein
MSAEELQAGADWVYAQFYRLDRILGRFARAVWTTGWVPAWLGLKLGLTYRYDNRREGIKGWDPMTQPMDAKGYRGYPKRSGWLEARRKGTTDGVGLVAAGDAGDFGCGDWSDERFGSTEP